MEILSKTEYEDLGDLYHLPDQLSYIGLPGIYFAKAAISIVKSIRDLFFEGNEEKALKAFETVEKYFSGEATKEECNEIASEFEAIIKAAEDEDEDPGDFVRAAYFIANFASTTDTSDASTASYYIASRAAEIFGAYDNDACDILKQEFPWELVCATQIAKCFGNEKDEQFIQEIMKNEKLINYATIILENEKLINYATIILEDEKLREKFKFLMNVLFVKDGNLIS